MSLIQHQPNSTRKRPRSSFSEWNSMLKGNFNENDENDEFMDLKQQQQDNNTRNNMNINMESSVIVLDSDDDTYALDNDTDETDSIVFIREEKSDHNQQLLDEQLPPPLEHHHQQQHQVQVQEQNGFFDNLKINQLFRSNVNDSFNLNIEATNNFPQAAPVHVGLKKRRTNSLPQLPLSQISYRRVSESYKIGEVKPNVIVPRRTSSNSYSSYADSNAYGSSAGSYSSNDYSHYDSSLSKTSISPFSKTKDKVKVTDENGYYIAEPGELFANDRFKILSILGQGTFGKVIKALDLEKNETVAIKIIKAIPKYREASKIELRILTTLKKADPDNLNNCIHLREVFDYENHICIVTDLLDINLYEFLQKNKFKPFPGSQIQAIARQLIRSIAFLHDLKLIHTDLKPENILLTSSDFLKFKKNKVLRNPLINIIDFGSAIFNDEYHSDLVSTRHYRAPEIVLGIGWSFPCDLWSLGCILVELVTGEALFSTHENLEHLAMMEKVLGNKLPKHLIQRVTSGSVMDFFKKTGHSYVLNYPNISTTEKSIDFVSKLKRIDSLICSKLKLKINIDITESLSKNWERNRSKCKVSNYETFQFWYYFIDLVFKLLNYDPDKRISAIDALNHRWWDYGIIDEATSML